MYYLIVILFIAIPGFSFDVDCFGNDTSNCSPKYCVNGTFVNNCVEGYIGVSYMNVTIKCLCSCTNHWARMSDSNCHAPRRHKLGCRFGGPRWGFNCWNNELSVEARYTYFEDLVSRNLPSRVIVNFTSFEFHYEKLPVID